MVEVIEVMMVLLEVQVKVARQVLAAEEKVVELTALVRLVQQIPVVVEEVIKFNYG